MNQKMIDKILAEAVMKKAKAHSPLSASGSERWLNCAPSVALIEEAPEPEETVYSTEGTLAHFYLEQWLEAKKWRYKFFLHEELKKNSDMYHAVLKAVDFIEEIWDEETQELYIEEKISLEFIDESMFGTGDVALVERGKHLQVWDYKHGKGHAVDVWKPSIVGKDYNSQLIYYALGLANKFNYDFKKVTIGVLQPRAKHKEGWKRSQTFSMKELRKYEYIFSKGVERVKKNKGRLEVGAWCWFCPARNFNCPAHEALKYEKAEEMFKDVKAED